MKTISKRTKHILIYFLLCLIFLAGLVMPASRTVYAGGTQQEFEFTETETELYEYRKYDDITLIRFYENDYGRESLYSLSFYIYNPNRVEFAVDTRNKVQIGYANNSTDVFRAKYNKYMITKDGQSETGLFVRFKISGFDMPVDVDRFYCFSGIELVEVGDQNATEYPVSKVYQCNTKDGVTTISTSTLPTCEVDVNHTYYRTNYSDKGINWNNQLSMCYFALPESYAGKGTLEALTAEFYNYYTKHIIITSNNVLYKELYPNYVGKNKKEHSNLDIEFWANPYDTTGVQNVRTLYRWAYATGPKESSFADKYIDTLYWFFYDEIKEGEPDFLSEDYNFSGEYLRAYFYNYSLEHGRAKAILDLFVSEKEYKEEKLGLTGFDYGYNKHTYSIAEKPENEDDVFGFKFRDNGYTNFFGITSSEKKEVVPLVKIEIDDLNLSEEEFSEKYYIEKREVQDIKAYVVQQSAMNKETWILRYDCCEYYGTMLNSASRRVFAAQESVYLDFDILSFRFAQGDTKYTVANIMSPEDVFNDITGAKRPDSWWDRFMDWLKNLFSIIGAWGTLILCVAVGILALWLFFKLIRFVCDVAQNPILRLVLVLSLIAGLVVLGYFYVDWAISVISGLGGLW